MITDKLLPRNEQAEQNVIAAILLDSKAYFTAKGIIDWRDFHFKKHRVIFYALEKLYAEHGEEVDIVKLSDDLKQQNKLEEAGGLEYLLTLVESIPTAANIKSHAKIVKEKAILRKIATLGQKFQLEAMEDNSSPSQILDGFSNSLFDLLADASGYGQEQDLFPPQKMAKLFVDRVYTAMEHPGKLRGIAVGFPNLDFNSKGLREFTLIAAETGKGKTVLALNWAVNLGVKKQIPCLYIN